MSSLRSIATQTIDEQQDKECQNKICISKSMPVLGNNNYTIQEVLSSNLRIESPMLSINDSAYEGGSEDLEEQKLNQKSLQSEQPNQISDQKINVVKHFESERNSATRINIELLDEDTSPRKAESKLENSPQQSFRHEESHQQFQEINQPKDDSSSAAIQSQVQGVSCMQLYNNEQSLEERSSSIMYNNEGLAEAASIRDSFQTAQMKRTIEFNPTQFNFPMPEELIKKSIFVKEEARTGAPIQFLKLQKLWGRQLIEKLNTDKNGANKKFDREAYDYANATTVSEYIINSFHSKKLIYCRYGEKYVTDLEKRKNSCLASSNLPSQNLASASYLLNIKKLIEEHNYEGDKTNKMKSNKMDKKGEQAPQQFYKLQGPDDKTLIFESRFESGNLLAVVKVTDTEYDLILSNDINTNGHTQWYFFRVSNTKKGMKIRFNIINLAKPDSLYNYGMKILTFSNKIKAAQGIGWHRIGQDIDYHQNNFKKDGNPRFQRNYYTLTFEHTYQVDDDIMFFAHCFPYTYTDLQDDLSRIEKDSSCSNFFHRSVLCRTLAGNRCDMITITSKDKDPNSAKAKAKKGVFISARIHPGESNSSWVMRGVVEFLTSTSLEARALRENFVFRIVPMINVDGVINGNYRCSLSGQDLNRRWKNPSKIVHPVIFNIKKMMRQFSKERQCILYCDLHGHSRRKNIFMYGNNLKERPHATRVFPYILSKLCDFFSFESSRFSMSKYKEQTARLAMFKELGIPNIFTLEASFCGADKGQFKDQHFTTDYLQLAGRRLLESLIVYCKIDVNQSIKTIKYLKKKEGEDQPVEEEDNDVKEYLKHNLKDVEKELAANKQLMKMTEGREDGESSGSDSEPSADNLSEDEMAQVVPIKPKVKPPVKPLPPPPAKKIIPPLIVPKVKKPHPQSPQISAKRTDLQKLQAQQLAKKKNFPLFDKNKKQKPVMVDAQTQTTPRAQDERRRHRKEMQLQARYQHNHQQQLQHQNIQHIQQQQQNIQSQQLNLSPQRQILHNTLRQLNPVNPRAQPPQPVFIPQRQNNNDQIMRFKESNVTGAAAAFIEQQKQQKVIDVKLHQMKGPFGGVTQMGATTQNIQNIKGQPALFQNELLNKIQQQRLAKKNSNGQMIKQDTHSLLPTGGQPVDEMESKKLLLTEEGNDLHPQIRVREQKKGNKPSADYLRSEISPMIQSPDQRRELNSSPNKMNYKELMPKANSLQQQNEIISFKNSMNSPNKGRNLIAAQNSSQIDSKRMQQATKIFSDNNVNVIKEQSSPRDLLPDISQMNSSSGQRSQKRQSFNNHQGHQNNASMDHAQIMIGEAGRVHQENEQQLNKFQQQIKQKSGLSQQNYQSQQHQNHTSTLKNFGPDFNVQQNQQMMQNHAQATRYQRPFASNDMIKNHMQHNMTQGNFSPTRTNRSLVPSLASSQFQKNMNYDTTLSQIQAVQNSIHQSQNHKVHYGQKQLGQPQQISQQQMMQNNLRVTYDQQQIQKTMNMTSNFQTSQFYTGDSNETKVNNVNKQKPQIITMNSMNTQMTNQAALQKKQNSIRSNNTDPRSTFFKQSQINVDNQKQMNQSIDHNMKGVVLNYDFNQGLPNLAQQQPKISPQIFQTPNISTMSQKVYPTSNRQNINHQRLNSVNIPIQNSSLKQKPKDQQF